MMAVYTERPQGSRAERLTSFSLDDIAVPTGREEEWRFTPVTRLAPLFEPAHHPDAVTMDVSLAPEVEAEVVPTTDPRLGKAGKPGDRTAVAAWNATQQAVVVTIPEGVAASEVTTLDVRALTSDPEVVQILVHAKPHSQAVVVLDHHGVGTVNETVEMVVEDHADLTVVAVQDWDDGAIHASSHRSVLGEGARLKHVVVTFGGDVVRVTPDASFLAEDGNVEMVGLYFADAGQHLEHRLFVDHSQPNCVSRVTYKGALQGAGAHAVWVGDVLIQAAATGTDTYELNRNLVLTKGARADSVPNLEIETGEIEGAGHASATGRFDDEQLYYLMSRGITEPEARRLVVHGFFAELLSDIDIPEVKERLLASIEEELEHSMTAMTSGGK
ncbi:MAG: Fe-S cluster assembly protein SufD [Cellulomonadaceae bacterium]|jgi:Fe-S cluster assembly protein SufD|nr:Fe-S cluster assembly protein SufD [Cellulomonadaceae bacterium]